MKHSKLTVYGYDWVPDFARGHVRDFRVRWALQEAGFGYDVALVTQGTQGEPEHLARQPFAQIPVMEVDGAPMFESGAIVWRIAEESEALLPPEVSRDRAFSWHISALNTVEPLVMTVVMLREFISDKEAGAKVLPDFEKMTDVKLARLADALGGNDYLLGDRFTVVDLIMAAVLRNLEGHALMEAHPALAAYTARCLERPGCRKAVADQCAEIDAHAERYQQAV